MLPLKDQIHKFLNFLYMIHLLFQVESWTFHARCVETFRLGNTTIFLRVTAAPDFSSAPSEGTDNTFAKPKTREVVLLTRPTGINAELVVYKNAKKLA